jgi:soluble lytic murein transglycosylase-like protein
MITILLFSFLSLANAETDVYTQIVTNKPNIDKQKAEKIAKTIKKVRKQYRLPAGILTAILMQESSYRLNAVNKSSSDYGIAQINVRTAKHFEFDTERLLTDLEYSIEAGAIVLADFYKRYGHREKDWFTRYNHSNPEIRGRYLEKLVRWMPAHLRAEHEKIEN